MNCPRCKNHMKRDTYKYNSIKTMVKLYCPGCGHVIRYEVRGICYNS